MRSVTLQKKKFLEKSPSSIHGTGIFTTINLAHGKEFYVVPMNDLRKTPSPRCARLTEGLFVSDETVLNWVNHSCEPNSELIFQQNKVVLRSKREIKKGEEITLDYCVTEERNKLVQCTCGSQKCRNYFFVS